MLAAYTETVCPRNRDYTALAVPRLAAFGENMPMGYGENIEKLRKAHKLSQAALAEMVGVEQPTVQRWEKNKREPDYEALTNLADALGVEPGAFFAEDVTAPLGPRLYVKGAVQAGQWVEAYEWPEEEWKFFDGRAGVHAKLEHRFGLRVIGDSMNLKYPAGSIVECISVFGHVESLPGRRVVIVRRRDDLLYEATVKRLVEENGELWAVPESTNPAFRAFKLSEPEPGIIEQRIAAVVVRALIDED